MIISGGVSIGAGIVFSTDSAVIQSGLQMYLDAATYPGSGSTWTDSTGNGYDATLFNSPAYSTSNGGYFTFSPGSSQYATVAGTPLNVSSYTKSVWFMLDTTSDNNLISSDIDGHYMFFGGTSKMYCGHSTWSGFPLTYQSTASFSNSVWYCATLTFNTTDGMALYINGVLDSTYTDQKMGPLGSGTNIACYGAAGNLLSGKIAQALIYNRSLNAGEVLLNYNNQKSRFGL